MSMADTARFFDAMENLQKRCHEMSRSKGFWTGPDNENVPTKLCLIHSEISEWLEALRKGNPDCEKDISVIEGVEPRRISCFEEEAADVFIRLLDLCEYLKIDLARVTLAKMQYNSGRPPMHGGKRC